MDIIQFSQAIFNEEPKAPREVALELDTMTSDVSEAFEVVSLFLLEGINSKIINNPRFNDEDLNIKKFIQEKVQLLKQYCQSIGVDFKADIITKKDVKNMDLYDRPIFYAKDKYNFFMTFLFNKRIRKGKQHVFKYNPGRSKLSNLKDGIMILKIQNNHFKIQFKYL